MLLSVLWNPLGLVSGALGRLLAALLVFMRPLGGTSDFENLFGEATGHSFFDGLWHVARVRLRNRFILLMSILLLAYYLILFFQIVVFPSLGPSRCRFGPPKRALQPSGTE